MNRAKEDIAEQRREGAIDVEDASDVGRVNTFDSRYISSRCKTSLSARRIHARSPFPKNGDQCALLKMTLNVSTVSSLTLASLNRRPDELVFGLIPHWPESKAANGGRDTSFVDPTLLAFRILSDIDHMQRAGPESICRSSRQIRGQN